MPVVKDRRRWLTTVLLLCLSHLAGAIEGVFPELSVSEDAGLPSAGYAIEIFRTDEGLPQNSINAILQSRDGYLWMGTYNGLARFDGVRFKVFDGSSTLALSDGRVTSLLEDSDGTLWMGHENGGVTVYRGGVFHNVDLGKRWPRAEVVGISEETSGEIWALNTLGIMIRVSDLKLLEPLTAAEDRPVDIPSLLDDAAGNVWVIHRGAAAVVDSAGLVPVEFSDAEGTRYVEELCASSDGGLWVITSTTVRRWKDGVWGADLGPCPWGNSAISCAMETHDGRLAVGTLDRGLFIVSSSDKAFHLNRGNGLSHEWVRSLCEDHEGNLWVGTGGGGLCVLREAKVAMANPPDEWLGRTTLSVSPGREGELWVGTEGAGLYRLRRGEWTHYGAEEGLPNPFIWSVLVDRRGLVHAGTWGEGLFVRKDTGFSIAPGWGELRTPVTSLFEAADDTLWVGTSRGLLELSATNITWAYGNQEALFPHVRTILEDHVGTIWFGTSDHGLGRLQDGVVKMFTTADGLASNYILGLSIDADGTLWIGTLDNGLCRFRQGSMRTINRASGLANNVIGAVADDGLGYLWLSSQKGILRVSKRELNRYADGESSSVHCLVYGKRQGLTTMACSAGFSPSWCRTADGRLVFPTARGVAVVDPWQVELNTHPPSVQIEDVLVEGRILAATNPPAEPVRLLWAGGGAGSTGETALKMEPHERRLEIHYTALSYVAPEAVRFRYKLEPLEKEWVDGGSRRFANYSFVPPGDYTFQVIACNNDGLWSPTGARLEVRVLPRFWETWWFRILAACGVMATAVGLVVFYTRRRLRRKLERLESERAVEQERTRIAHDIHDDLGASLTRILMLTQEGSVQSEGKEAIEGNIREVHSTARELTREMDEIVWAVSPEHDTLESLVNYLCRFAQTFLNAAHLRCRLDAPLDIPVWAVHADVRHNLFLAFKEALNNIVKHAGATEVRVTIELLPAELRLQLRDDGRGLRGSAAADAESGTADPDRIESGLGLDGIHRRLNSLGGRFKIVSVEGEGTDSEFHLPFKAMSDRRVSARRSKPGSASRELKVGR